MENNSKLNNKKARGPPSVLFLDYVDCGREYEN